MIGLPFGAWRDDQFSTPWCNKLATFGSSVLRLLPGFCRAEILDLHCGQQEHVRGGPKNWVDYKDPTNKFHGSVSGMTRP